MEDLEIKDRHHNMVETFKEEDKEEVVAITTEAVEEHPLEEDGVAAEEDFKEIKILSNFKVGQIKWILASNNFRNKWHPKINNRCSRIREEIKEDEEEVRISMLNSSNNHKTLKLSREVRCRSKWASKELIQSSSPKMLNQKRSVNLERSAPDRTAISAILQNVCLELVVNPIWFRILNRRTHRKTMVDSINRRQVLGCLSSSNLIN